MEETTDRYRAAHPKRARLWILPGDGAPSQVFAVLYQIPITAWHACGYDEDPATGSALMGLLE